MSPGASFSCSRMNLSSAFGPLFRASLRVVIKNHPVGVLVLQNLFDGRNRIGFAD